MQLTTEAPTRSIALSWEDPAPGRKHMAQLPGIEYIRSIQDGTTPPLPFARLLGLEIPFAEPGRVTFSFTPDELWLNPMGTLHGGIIGTLLDTAMGMAVQSQLPAGTGFTTLEYKVNFLRPVLESTGRVFAEATVMHSGRTQAVLEARLVDAAGKLFAFGTSTCAILAG